MSVFGKKKKKEKYKRAEKGKAPYSRPETVKTNYDFRYDIFQKIGCLQTQLKAPPLPEFRFNLKKFEYYFDGISYAAHEPGIVASMVTDILNHLGMPPEYINVKVEYITEDAAYQEIGTYSQTDALRGTVVIRIKPSYVYDTVISIAAHECTHHYLLNHNIKLEETRENERLTDIATIYLGCGFYYTFGSDLGKEVTNQTNSKGQTVTTTITHRLGYLSKEEFEFAYSEIKKLRQKYEKELGDRKAEFRDKAFRLLKQYETDIRKNKELVGSVGSIKLICEDERNQKLARIFYKSQTDNVEQFYGYTKEKLQKGLQVDEIDSLCKNMKERLQMLRDENEFLTQCLRIADFQALLDEHVRDYIAGILTLVESGNVFAMYEKMKFYASVPDSTDDAKALLESLLKRNDMDALFVLGRCCREGIGVEKNDDMARYYYYNAWLNGSEDAKKEMDTYL